MLSLSKECYLWRYCFAAYPFYFLRQEQSGVVTIKIILEPTVTFTVPVACYFLLFHQLKWVKAHRMWTYQRRKLSEAPFPVGLLYGSMLILIKGCSACGKQRSSPSSPHVAAVLSPEEHRWIILLAYLTLKENQQNQFKESIKTLFKAKYCSYHHTFLF